jgi:hypothetical protein
VTGWRTVTHRTAPSPPIRLYEILTFVRESRTRSSRIDSKFSRYARTVESRAFAIVRVVGEIVSPRRRRAVGGTSAGRRGTYVIALNSAGRSFTRIVTRPTSCIRTAIICHAGSASIIGSTSAGRRGTSIVVRSAGGCRTRIILVHSTCGGGTAIVGATPVGTIGRGIARARRITEYVIRIRAFRDGTRHHSGTCLESKPQWEEEEENADNFFHTNFVWSKCMHTGALAKTNSSGRIRSDHRSISYHVR